MNPEAPATRTVRDMPLSMTERGGPATRGACPAPCVLPRARGTRRTEPVAPGDRTFLAEMMESVEDIPRDAILEGLSWEWSTYPEYLDAVQKMAPSLNIVGMVGHCAMRYHVMGERSLSDEPPTPAEPIARTRQRLGMPK